MRVANRAASQETQIANDLRAHFHITFRDIAAFLGSFRVESDFNPHSYNPRENAHGYANWEGGRWTALQAFARRHHLAPTSTAAELGYLNAELAGPYAGVLAQVKRAPNLYTATQIVQSQYEGSTPASLPAREAAASRAYGQLAAGKPLTGGPSTVPGSVPGSAGWKLPGGLGPGLILGGPLGGLLGSAAGTAAGGFFAPLVVFLTKGFFVAGGVGLAVLGAGIAAKNSSAGKAALTAASVAK